jgi:hypothetical protein
VCTICLSVLCVLSCLSVLCVLSCLSVLCVLSVCLYYLSALPVCLYYLSSLSVCLSVLCVQDDRLRVGVAKYGIGNWNAVANFVGDGLNNEQCRRRWLHRIGPEAVERQAAMNKHRPWDPWEVRYCTVLYCTVLYCIDVYMYVCREYVYF